MVVIGGRLVVRFEGHGERGQPFIITENLDVVGTPTTQGLRALADAYPPRDAPSVERLKIAGAIPIGSIDIGTFVRDTPGHEQIERQG